MHATFTGSKCEYGRQKLSSSFFHEANAYFNDYTNSSTLPQPKKFIHTDPREIK